MSAQVVIGLGLALLASLALNGSFLLQHSGSRETAPVTLRRPRAALAGLLGSRLWLAGLALGLAGWGLHVAALSKAPLAMVQAFAGGGIALAAAVAARALGERLSPGERRGIILTALALVLLAAGSGATATTHRVPAAPLAVYLLAAFALAGALTLAPAGRRRAQALGLAGGVLYGAGDTTTKALTTLAHEGLTTALLSPWAVVLVLASAGAFVCFQRGLQLGPVVPVIALMTAATNLISIAAGLAVFGEPLGHPLALAAAHGLAFALVGVAAWLLAPAQARLSTGADLDERGGTSTESPAAPRDRPREHATTPAPSANASACSVPASSRVSGISVTNAARHPAATTSAKGRIAGARIATPATSAPSAPAQTHEIP